jgi:hypothetical protein
LPVVHGWVGAGEEDALVRNLLILKIGAGDFVGVEHGIHVLEEGDDVNRLRLELANPVADGDIALFEGLVLLADDEIGVVAVDAVNALGRGRHGQYDLEDGGNIVSVEELGGIEGAGYTLQRLQQYLGLGVFHGGVGHAQGDEDVLAQPVVAEKALVAGEQLLDDVVIDLFALAVPHLFVAGKVREGIIGFLYLVLAAELGVFGEEGRIDVIGVLGAHTLGYLHLFISSINWSKR